MAAADPLDDLRATSIARKKAAFEAAYGAIAGVTFALVLWGRDAYLLSTAHAFFPWWKLVLGMLLCGMVGGIVSWLSARIEGCISILIWLGAAPLFAWITVGLPLQLMPLLSESLEPGMRGLIDYQVGEGYMVRFWIALGWVAVFLVISGLLQSTAVESAFFSTSLFGRVAPFFICISMMAVAGVILDDLTNAPFRKAIFAVETPIHFILANPGKEVDRELAREFHAAALREVNEEVTRFHYLMVGGFDESFSLIDVIVKFNEIWVNCTTVNGQITFCEQVQPGP